MNLQNIIASIMAALAAFAGGIGSSVPNLGPIVDNIVGDWLDWDDDWDD